MSVNTKKKEENELEAALSRAVGTGASAGQNLGAYKDANGKTTTYRPEFSGQTVQMGNQYVTYNENGYPTKAVSVSHAQSLGNDYTSKNMGLDQTQIANAGDIYRALYNTSMSSPASASGSLSNAYGKRNIQYDSGLSESDYNALIKQAANSGNNVLAGFYEDSLNALLHSLGMDSKQTSVYNGGWNYTDNGGGVGNIYRGAQADPLQTDQALGGGWYAGQGLGNAAEEYFYRNTDAPTMQEVIAYAKMKGYDVDNEDINLPLTELARQMISNGYVSPGTQKTASSLGVALPSVLQNLGLSADGGIGTDALEAAIQSMRKGIGTDSDTISDEALQLLYEAAATPFTPAGSTTTIPGGSGNNAYGGIGSLGGYSGGIPAQSSGISASVNALLQQLLGMNFEDWTKGDTYASLAGRYGDQGRQAMQNVLGQVSSRTGGLASSYATTAAQQQYNEHMAMLDEVARQMFDSERNDLLENFGLVRDMEQDAYNRQQDALEWDYRYQQDAYNRQQAAQEDAFNKQMAAAELLAGIGDYSGYKALGLTDAQIAALGSAYAAQQTSKLRTGGGGGDDSSEDVPVAAPYANTGTDYWLGDGSTPGGKTSLSWDEDEGVFTWNGKNYSRMEDVANAIDAANLTDTEKAALQKKFALFGFDISF